MSQYFAPFDSETGGLSPETSDLLTFYMCVMDENFKICDELYLKLKPDGGRPPVTEAQALKINGINIRDHLADPTTITYSEGKKQLQAMLGKFSQKIGRSMNIRPLGYNVPFDENFTWKHLISREEWLQLMHYKRVDVMERVDFLKEAGWFPQDLGSLGTVVDYLQLPKRAAHNAKEDTLMCVDVYRKLLELMKSKKDGGTAQDLISLLEAE
jgi:DNA polymerase III epsilon subunit-like protein